MTDGLIWKWESEAFNGKDAHPMEETSEKWVCILSWLSAARLKLPSAPPLFCRFWNFGCFWTCIVGTPIYTSVTSQTFFPSHMPTPASDKEERTKLFSTAKAKDLSWMPRLWAPIHIYSQRSHFFLLLRTKYFCFLIVNVLQLYYCTSVTIFDAV